MNITSKRNHLFQILGLLQSALYIFLYFKSQALQNNYKLLPLFLLGICIIFVLYFFSLFFLKKNERNLFGDPFLLFSILFFAFVFRLISFFLPPVLSDDLFYYVWHGKISAEGLNPYLFTPHSPALEFLRDSQIWTVLPFKDLPPAYPPLVMLTFWLAFKIGGSSLLAFKLLLWLPEALSCFFGIKLLQLYKKNPTWILIYAWCPLPILEYMGMGHSDVWGIAFLTAFLYFFKKEKIPLAFIFLALATLVKWIPLLFLPFLFRKISWRQRGMALLCLGGTILLLYLPFLSAGKQVFGLLPTYLKSWEFNASLYPLIRLCFERADVTHAVVSALAGLWALFVACRNPSLEKGLFSITFFFFLVFHTVYPWYLGWLLPLLLLVNCWAAYAWLFTSFFSYWILIGYRTQGLWKENIWILLLEYLPVFGLLILQNAWSKKADSSRK